MQDIRLSYEELGSYLIAFNILLGLLFGFFPLLAGLKLHNRKYGVFGLLCSVFGGAVAGLFLAFPAAALFTWLIFRSVNEKYAAVAGSEGDVSADAQVTEVSGQH